MIDKYLNQLIFGIAVGLIVLCVALILFASHAESRAREDCLQRGGQWTIDHYETSGIISGGSGAVTTNPVYACRQGTR